MEEDLRRIFPGNPLAGLAEAVLRGTAGGPVEAVRTHWRFSRLRRSSAFCFWCKRQKAQQTRQTSAMTHATMIGITFTIIIVGIGEVGVLSFASFEALFAASLGMIGADEFGDTFPPPGASGWVPLPGR